MNQGLENSVKPMLFPNFDTAQQFCKKMSLFLGNMQ